MKSVVNEILQRRTVRYNTPEPISRRYTWRSASPTKGRAYSARALRAKIPLVKLLISTYCLLRKIGSGLFVRDYHSSSPQAARCSGRRTNMFFIFHGRFPGEKAAAVFAAKNAEAFADAGLQVIFLAPRRLGRSKKTPAEFYGIKNNFRVVYLPTIDFFSLPFFKRAAFIISYVVFSKIVFLYLLFFARRGDIVYSNEALPLFLAFFIRPNTFYEMHDFPSKTFFNKLFLSRPRCIIATNKWKKERIMELFRLPERKLFFVPNSVDLSLFEEANGLDVRQKFFGQKSKDAIISGYAGALRTMDMEKGLETFIEAMRALPDKFCALIVGGYKDDIEYYKKLAADSGVADRLVFTGWVKHNEVPRYLRACDVLAAPFPGTDHYKFYMSPMKIFEYMASGRPIIASDLPSIREIVDESMVFFANPDDPQSFVDAIENAVNLPGGALIRAERARKEVEKYTWKARAVKILLRMREVLSDTGG